MPAKPEHYRPATQAEIQQAGSNSESLEDWQAARKYALSLFGPTVARVRLVIDHNNDDGEESLYVMSGFYGYLTKESYTPVWKDGYWYAPDELHRGWDADGNELPLLVKIQSHYMYDSEGNEVYPPEFNDYDHWHMEFDFSHAPTTIVLYVKEG